MNKFWNELAKSRKEGKLDHKTYHKVYPSDAIPPQLYGVIKAHKPEKNYPIRAMVSIIEAVPFFFFLILFLLLKEDS